MYEALNLVVAVDVDGGPDFFSFLLTSTFNLMHVQKHFCD